MTGWPLPPLVAGIFGLTDFVDIVATAFVMYYLLWLIRGTRAVQIALGLGVLLAMLGIANLLHLLLLTTLLQVVVLGTALTLPIVFQPELRRALEQLGRGGLVGRRENTDRSSGIDAALGVIARSALLLSRARTGALIAIEGNSGLREFEESGTPLDAQLSAELLLTIFTDRSPLHDGAVIVKEARVLAAGCFLPLSENLAGERHLGTRHRAALGLSEQTDAVVVVVSEQTGAISIARAGRLSREFGDEERLRSVLIANCHPPLARGWRAALQWRGRPRQTVPEPANPHA